MAAIRIDLTYPGVGDEWGEVLNANFLTLETEIEAIKSELTGVDALTTLKGTYTSLKARLADVTDAAGTLRDWTILSASRLDDTTTINSRLGKIEQQLLIAKSNEAFFDTSPAVVKRSIDKRELSAIDDQYSAVGSCNKMAQTAGSPLINSLYYSGPDAYMNMFQVATPISICNRWYSGDPTGQILGLTAGTWYFFAQTFSETTSATVALSHTNEILTGTTTPTTTTITVGSIVPGFDAEANDIIELTSSSNLYKIKSITGSGVGQICTIYGKIDDDDLAAGQPYILHRFQRVPYVSAHIVTEAVAFQMSMEPGRLCLGKGVVVIGPNSFTFTMADEFTYLNRHTYIDMTTWAGATAMYSTAFTGGLGFIKNIQPVVVTTAGEYILPAELTAGYESGNIYVRRANTAIVCVSPKTGANILNADVDHWGVIVEV